MANMPPSVTLRMDSTAGENVLAIGRDGTTYLVWWSNGFASGQPGDTLVLDPTGHRSPLSGGWFDFPGYTRVEGPGCYAYQVDVTAGTFTVTFKAQ